MSIPLVGGLAGSFLKNYIGKNFGGVPSRDASNADELEEARLQGGAMGLIPGMNVNQGFTEPYGDPRENIKNALGGLVGGAVSGGTPWQHLGGFAGDALKKGKFGGPIGGLASTFF